LGLELAMAVWYEFKYMEFITLSVVVVGNQVDGVVSR
jgi:hypothetical protein